MDAKALASFLNDYLGIMTTLIFDNQGTLDKYIGDAVMAFWGAPLDQLDHASHACKAAIDMMIALEKNQARFKSQYGIDVNIGIGMNSGMVNVGNMGSETNFEYTVIGDHVNLASRLEGLTKKYGASILTTRFTFDCIEKSGHSLPLHRTLDLVKVKGKKNAIELIQVFEWNPPAEGLELFSKARESYRGQLWDRAIEQFEKANQLLSRAEGVSDGPSEMYLDRCQYFKANPPPADWDGSWEMDSK
jgi:adenylate cyclase